MEPTKPIEPANSPELKKTASLVFVAFMATIAIVLNIFRHWDTYGWFNKVDALTLLGILVVCPVMVIRAEGKTPAKFGRAVIAIWGYAGLIMATSLLGR